MSSKQFSDYSADKHIHLDTEHKMIGRYGGWGDQITSIQTKCVSINVTSSTSSVVCSRRSIAAIIDYCIPQREHGIWNMLRNAEYEIKLYYFDVSIRTDEIRNTKYEPAVDLQQIQQKMKTKDVNWSRCTVPVSDGGDF